jgi:DNA-binding GntR family transcriptional regulator
VPSEDVRIPRTAQESVKEYLRSGILAGELAPGTRLAQSEIAATLKVSITPVREALRDLRMEGLVDVDTFRGAVVHVPSLRELDEIFAIRQRLVPLAIELGVSNITDDELAQCRRLVDEMHQTTDSVHWGLLNRRFHNILDESSRNRRLAEMLRQLSDVAALYVHLSLDDESDRRGEAEHEHGALVDAFASQDVGLATSLYLGHFEGTLRRARQHLTRLELVEGGSGGHGGPEGSPPERV